MKPADADQPPPPIVVLASVSRAGPSPIILPDRHADPGKEGTPRSGHNYRCKNYCRDHIIADPEKCFQESMSEEITEFIAG